MPVATPLPPFVPLPPDAAGIISWVHIGDLHMTEKGEQNHADLLSIVERINRVFRGSLSFVYLPGDIAEHGDAGAYRVVREAIDPLQVPWCSIIGDHDVQQKSFANYLEYMVPEEHYAFQVGDVHFVALNAFDVADPSSFCMSDEQLQWLEEQLHAAEAAVLFLHCYPSDLKQGGECLRQLVEKPAVRLIDMGHTHYNEIANYGRTLYTATRSTGQIEEGPVGFSVTNIDGPVISWKFFHLQEVPMVMITSPADERLITDPRLEGAVAGNRLRVRAKVWGNAVMQTVTAQLEGKTVSVQRIGESQVWQGKLQCGDLPSGVYPLTVSVKDANGLVAEDRIHVVIRAEAWQPPQRAARDQENPLAAWPEHGLLGTQLGPNKNGRKW